jgi:plasmid stability protein
MSTLIVKNFPDDLHRRIKAEAAYLGVTLRWLVKHVLKEYVTEQERKRREEG